MFYKIMDGCKCSKYILYVNPSCFNHPKDLFILWKSVSQNRGGENFELLLQMRIENMSNLGSIPGEAMRNSDGVLKRVIGSCLHEIFFQVKDDLNADV